MEYIFPLLFLLGIIFYFFNRSTRSTQHIFRVPENAELVRVLLNLEEEPLEQLFSLYKQQFGEGPARYARQTYKKWKSGSVRPNKQTFSRFLINLPKVMSFDLKCEVVRQLRETYYARDHHKLTVSTDDWKEKLTPLVESIMSKGKTAQFPAHLERKLSWLAEEDAQVANALLHHSQRQQSIDALAMLEQEFSNIENLLNKADGRGRVIHTLKLPYGTIALKIKRS